ncbi:Gfo/Idh/MocA family oxidoreductase [Paenibacillus aurantius]|uniref:Gfo/Idh/MocA family oxidoreductase n=1 Tax=Paenibacillus aurantius TaxID=2918900 RepID=A0AA96RE06_9BACL|nr:Gfo/Idh/MocA family oxidoreductase [Paenibacillus aurantius]WJH35102.1 Gfo/Idh/MocA family oxidoreductase [Paenibacillus sp. CC-CFT747]WNQ10362.1 Gfo/Idh/MocA family oxidoreductase [Paenibacillus aurantius]
MIRIGLVGLGFMGRTHLETYLRLEKEGQPIQVVAICDINPAKWEGQATAGNFDTKSESIDFSRFAKYTDMAEMLEKEELDAVDLCLPTYLHKDMSVLALNRGKHVMCEKPMAMNAAECSEMVEAADQNGKLLMIGQCLRFWPAYVYLKEQVDSGKLGKVRGAYFFRGGGTPDWAEWLTQKDKSGGALLDMHVHDIDTVNWLFGMPKAVSCLALNAVEGSGYDIVSTHYAYEDGKVINAQVDWTLQGDFGFDMTYRVNFEKGNIVFQNGTVKVNPSDGPGFEAELSENFGYYYEMKYFLEAITNGTPVDKAPPLSTKGSIEIAEAEIASADRQGAWIELSSR